MSFRQSSENSWLDRALFVPVAVPPVAGLLQLPLSFQSCPFHVGNLSMLGVLSGLLVGGLQRVLFCFPAFLPQSLDRSSFREACIMYSEETRKTSIVSVRFLNWQKKGSWERVVLLLHWLQYGELVSFRVCGYCGPAYFGHFLLWSDDFSAELLYLVYVFVCGLD